ncbi:F0F1 ATP synthase subunit delta [Candidatus Saccharibacteria bacterium]|nr:F0F1 ATP synthase subunit delta [Candidatus Saccharibacteria bacterium]
MAISRRQIAYYTADALHQGVDMKAIVKQLAAYLVEAKKTNELSLLLKDVEAILSEKYGVTLAKVTTARPLDELQRKELASFIKKQENSKEVTLQEITDPSLIGGVVIETPTSLLNASVSWQLQQLKALSKA